MQFDTETTICAIATGEAPAIRGAIRVNGPDTLKLLRTVCDLPNSIRFAERIETFVELKELGRIPVSVFCWPDSRSYTGQPSAELHTLGAPVLLSEIQRKLILAGIQVAQPGEFTLRAFLAGRLDLTQCEAVLGVIHAHDQRSLDVALNQLAGGLAAPLADTRRDLIHLLADIEAGLDFVDEDISFISPEQIESRLLESNAKISEVLQQMDSRGDQRHEWQIALIGPPNAGKSSLLNAMAGSDVAIVSPTPGTTRDYLRYRVQQADIAFDLLDTAGMEEWDDHSPRGMAQSFTRSQIDNADLLLYCLPCDEESEPIAAPILESVKPIWWIETKCDKPRVKRPTSERQVNTPQRDEFGEAIVSRRSIEVSALTGQGIDTLRNALINWVQQQKLEQADAVPMTVERCKGALENAKNAVMAAIESVRGNCGDEIIAAEIRIALDEIGLVAGTVYTEDVLDALFSRFCIGK